MSHKIQKEDICKRLSRRHQRKNMTQSQAIMTPRVEVKNRKDKAEDLRVTYCDTGWLN